MHSGGKGISKSSLPYKRAPPSWLKITPEEVSEHITRLAKKGLTPSQIGIILRDSHGIAQVKNVTGNKILRILKANGTCSAQPHPLLPAAAGRLLVFSAAAAARGDQEISFVVVVVVVLFLSSYARENSNVACGAGLCSRSSARGF